MSPKALDKMSVEELEAEVQKRAAERVGAKEHQMEAAAALDSKLTEEAARKALDSLSDSGKRALAQIIQTEGVESQEAVEIPNTEAVDT